MCDKNLGKEWSLGNINHNKFTWKIRLGLIDSTWRKNGKCNIPHAANQRVERYSLPHLKVIKSVIRKTDTEMKNGASFYSCHTALGTYCCDVLKSGMLSLHKPLPNGVRQMLLVLKSLIHKSKHFIPCYSLSFMLTHVHRLNSYYSWSSGYWYQSINLPGESFYSKIQRLI
jgi:hypothetical protein